MRTQTNLSRPQNELKVPHDRNLPSSSSWASPSTSADKLAQLPHSGDVSSSTQAVFLEEGLYLLSCPSAELLGTTHFGLELPAVLAVAPAVSDYNLVEILAGSGEIEGHLGPAGGVFIAKSPPGGGVVLLTTLGMEPPMQTLFEVRRVDAPPTESVSAPAEPALRPGNGNRPIALEILLHIEMMGDQTFPNGGWAGSGEGNRLRIEALGIRPLEILAPGDIEYMAFGPNGRETPWVTNGELCGTRGRSLPLTGFAVRLAGRLRNQYDAVYEGAFMSGVSGPHRNGEPCRPTSLDDPLRAINLRIVPTGNR